MPPTGLSMDASKSPLRSLGAGPSQRASTRVAGSGARGAPSARDRPARRDCAARAASQSVPARIERHGAPSTQLPGPALDRARVATPPDPRTSLPRETHLLRQTPSPLPLRPPQCQPPLSTPGAPLSGRSDTDHPTRLYIKPDALRQPALVSFVSLTRRRACVAGGPGRAHASLPVPPGHASAAPAGCGRLSPRSSRTPTTPERNPATWPTTHPPSENPTAAEKILGPSSVHTSLASRTFRPCPSLDPRDQLLDPSPHPPAPLRTSSAERHTQAPGPSRSLTLAPPARARSTSQTPNRGSRRASRPLTPAFTPPAPGFGTGRATLEPWHGPCAAANGAWNTEAHPSRFLSPASVRREEFIHTGGRAPPVLTRLTAGPPPPLRSARFQEYSCTGARGDRQF